MFIFVILFLIFLCGKTRENFYRSVALNIFEYYQMFNTTNRASKFPIGDYSDIVGIRLRKFTRIISKALLEIRLIVVHFQHSYLKLL